MLDKNSVEFATPQWFFDDLNDEFGPFDIDIAATDENAKCRTWISRDKNALESDWARLNNKVFCNSPYSKEAGPIGKWVEKAILESSRGCTVVMLLPADTRTTWFRKCCGIASEVRLVDGAFKFDGGATSARFGVCVVVFKPPRLYTYRRAM